MWLQNYVKFSTMGYFEQPCTLMLTAAVTENNKARGTGVRRVLGNSE